ncbi:hypothetical protein Bpfe_020013, partial [Biomphalaria pfeifferi]
RKQQMRNFKPCILKSGVIEITMFVECYPDHVYLISEKDLSRSSEGLVEHLKRK